MGQPVRSLSKARATAVEKPAPPAKSVAREYLEAGAIALALALFLRTFFIQAYKIPSGSMEPTLLIGDHILVNKILYGLRLPESLLGLPMPEALSGKRVLNLEPIHRGDVVVFVFPPDRSKDFIKRVVGVAGDTIEVRDAKVYLNGALMPDPHAHFEIDESARGGAPRDNFGPVKVPPGQLFVMGDNRDRSFDSRYWGFVDLNDVEGRAIVIYWSWDSDGQSVIPLRWDRFGKLVH